MSRSLLCHVGEQLEHSLRSDSLPRPSTSYTSASAPSVATIPNLSSKQRPRSKGKDLAREGLLAVGKPTVAYDPLEGSYTTRLSSAVGDMTESMMSLPRMKTAPQVQSLILSDGMSIEEGSSVFSDNEVGGGGNYTVRMSPANVKPIQPLSVTIRKRSVKTASPRRRLSRGSLPSLRSPSQILSPDQQAYLDSLFMQPPSTIPSTSPLTHSSNSGSPSPMFM